MRFCGVSLGGLLNRTSCIFRYSFPKGGTNIASVGERDTDARRFRKFIVQFTIDSELHYFSTIPFCAVVIKANNGDGKAWYLLYSASLLSIFREPKKGFETLGIMKEALFVCFAKGTSSFS